LSVAALGWHHLPGNERDMGIAGPIIGHLVFPCNAHSIAWAMVEFDPKVVAVCCPQDDCDALTRAAAHIDVPWVLHVDLRAPSTAPAEISLFERAAVVAPFRQTQPVPVMPTIAIDRALALPDDSGPDWDDLAGAWADVLTQLANDCPVAPDAPDRPVLEQAVSWFFSESGWTEPDSSRPSMAILTPGFIDESTGISWMGGAERYLIDLAELCDDLGIAVDAYQPSQTPARWQYGRLTVYGLGINGLEYDVRPPANLVFDRATRRYDHILYHCFDQCYPAARPGSVAISHGIWWDVDLPGPWRTDEWRRRLNQCFDNAGLLVSVDTSTMNWLRAERPELGDRLRYIPNCVDLDAFHPPTNRREAGGPARVLFPRRLTICRGTELMVGIAEDLIRARDDVCFHFVGRGDPLAEEGVSRLAAGSSRIDWEWRPLEQMPEVYQQADITVIPTLCSEGTSLSCLEAMATGNAIVATNIGGLGNLIIDGYNGLLVEPNREAVQQAVEQLLDDPDLRLVLGRRALETAEAFSKARWQDKWRDILIRMYPAPER
ncbi:MAG TPA: glycosyltransferase family 4 protein, partial [Armatimonadota bacterium]|nr:glycosyltransferase family 4 protein [Armatimonadota bacterium]